MKKANILVFTACYNERDNIGLMIDQIAVNVPEADILIVDDNSPDGTWDVIEQKKQHYNNLKSTKRPRKLGVGSAHKYAIFYAMREGYETLVTLDADFSHDPKLIPNLINMHGKNVFVTGSRYCEGGSSDYSGYRDIVSRMGNFVARLILGVKLRELTTYFRVFDVDSLRKLPLRRVASSGYSYGVELIYYLRKAGVELREYPIHFSDRTRGTSKIPRLQIFKSAFDLIELGLRRLNFLRDLQPDVFVADKCPNCEDAVLAMKHFGSRRQSDRTQTDSDYSDFKCTSVGKADYPPVYTCLCCGLEQVPNSLAPAELKSHYRDVIDAEYLENIPAREKTYARCFNQIEPFAPKQPGFLLEVGSYCGIFLKEAKRRGWDGDGVEPSKWAVNYAREVSKVNVYPGYLEENQKNLRPTYDIVAAWDVLEHVSDPKVFIELCGEYLSPGGTLCFSTLDVDSWLPKLLRTRWPWLTNMHLFYFDRASVEDMLQRTGLSLIHTGSYVHYARLRYVYERGLMVLPGFIRVPLSIFTKLIPAGLVLPISFGDLKMFVARKKSPEIN